MQRDGLVDQAARLDDRLTRIDGRVLGARGRPVALHTNTSRAVPRQAMSGRQLEHARKDGARIGHIPERHVLPNGLGIELARKSGKQQQRAQLGRERDPILGRPIVHRLDAEPIARDQQRFGACVPDGEPEHPTQRIDEPRPILLVQVDERLRITARRELVPITQQAILQRAIVVDLAVEDDVDGPFLVSDRLVAAAHVDDAESTHAERHATVHVVARVIGTAMADRIAHPLQDGARGIIARRAADKSGYPAHQRTVPTRKANALGAAGARRRTIRATPAGAA